MPSRYTDAEWTSFVGEIERDIDASDRKYSRAEVGEPAFLRTIDHTLLKLETKSAQIDDLCAEARVGGFAVCQNHFIIKVHFADAVSECVRSSQLCPPMRRRPQRLRRQSRLCGRIPRRRL